MAYITDYDFDFYSDEPPIYFTRPANEFDGIDPQNHINNKSPDESLKITTKSP